MELGDARILVIGGAGLIGSHVVEALLAAEVREVIVYDNFCRGTRENLAQALEDPRCSVFDIGGDILHPDLLATAMEGVDGVVHLAALWLLHCHEYPRSAFEVNIAGTFNVLEAARQAGVKKVVYSSSASVYGDAVTTPMTEDHPFHNTTFYGATKIAGEAMFHAYHHRYGLDWVGLRYMNVYGARQDYRGAYIAVIMKVLDRIDAGLPPIVYGDGSQTYDFIYVSDVAEANVCALRSVATDQCYNVGSGIGTTIQALCDRLLQLTGTDLQVQYEPAGQTFVTERIGCPEAAARDLGFRTQVDLEDGLQRLIAWRRSHIATQAAPIGVPDA